MSYLHNTMMCAATLGNFKSEKIEQRPSNWRCSIAFNPRLATAVILLIGSAVAQAQTTSAIATPLSAVQPPNTLIRPIVKAATPILPPSGATTATTAASSAPPTQIIGPAVKEFRSLGDLPAVLYDAPSLKAKKLSILFALNPLEILARTDRWVKVRDAVGEIGWVEAAVLTERRLVAVTAAVAQVRVAAIATEPLAFEAERGVVLEMMGSTTDGWLAVRHRDGNAGFVLRSQVFGQ